MNVRPRPQLIAGIHWVRGELEQSITRARTLIDHYAESGGDPLQLQQAYVELHQVRGTAAMIQCYGLAAVAQEMTAGLQDLTQERVPEPDPLYSALLGATIQLSDYIQALAEGTPDCALVMQPTINELRLARGQAVLTESDIFVAQMQALGSALPSPDRAAGDAQREARRLLPVFQASLLSWIRGAADAQTGAARVGKISELVAEQATDGAVHQLWRIGAAAVEAYLGRGFGSALELKRLFGRAGGQLKLLAESGEAAASAPAAELSLQLLFQVGRSTSHGPRVEAIRRGFELDAYLPEAGDLEQLRRRIHGPSTSLLKKVSEEIRSDFSRVKDQIDLMVRTGAGDTAATLAGLKRIGDTLAALGLLRLQALVVNQARMLAPADGSTPAASVWLDLATSVLRVENDLEEALFRQMQRRNDGAPEVSDDIPASRDLAEGREALYREFLVNLARVKAAVDSFLRSGGSAELPDAALLIDEIASGFDVLGHVDAAALLRRLRRMVAGTPFARLREDPVRADRFADAVAAVEYFIEAVRSGLPTAGGILTDLARSLEALEAIADPRGEAEALAALAAEPIEPMPVTEVTPQPAAAAPAAPAIAAEDPEIREIFLEEAAEVHEAARSAFAAWSRDSQDREALTTLRRAFHTLKGSGRTVGAAEIGEFGWALESLLNRCLDGSIGASPGVVETVGRALTALPALIEAFRERAAPPDEIAAICEYAREYAAGRTPGVAPEPDMAAVFREDASEKLGGVLVWLEANAGPVASSVEPEVVRAFHTIRGAARIVDAPAISELSGALEAYLDALTEAHLPVEAAGMQLLREACGTLQQWIGEIGPAGAAQQQDASAWVRHIETLQAAVPVGAVQASAERQLTEIFAGEAFDLVSRIEEQVRGWSQAPDNRRAAQELKGLSHTLLGAAQMSECPGVATVARALHAAFGGAAAQGLQPRAEDLQTLADVCEQLFQYLDRFRSGRLDGDEAQLAPRIHALGWGMPLNESEEPPAGADAVERAVTAPDTAAADVPELQLAGFETPADPAAPAPIPGETLVDPAAGPEAQVAELQLGDPDEVVELVDEGEVVDLRGDEGEVVDLRGDDPAADFDGSEEVIQMPPVEGDGEPGVEVADAGQAAAGPSAPGLPAGSAAREVDPELLQIFQLEAEELLEGLDQSAAALERDPRNLTPMGEIKRLLHTFKGSARVSGLLTLGEVGHRLEGLFEQLELGEVSPGTHFFARVQNVLDGLHLALDDLRRGVIPEPVHLLDELAQPLAASAAPAQAPASPAPPPPAVMAPPPQAFAPRPPPPARPPAQPLPEGFDVELAQTFATEAEELMEILESALPRWQALPGDYTPARDMLRALHTYKGGARMAGLAVMGDAAHELESLIEGLEYARELDPGALLVVAGAVAELRALTDRLERGEYAALASLPDEDEPAFEQEAEPDTGAAAEAGAEGFPAASEMTEMPAMPGDDPAPAPAPGAPDAPLLGAGGTATEITVANAAVAGLWDPLLFWRPADEHESLSAQRRETARVPVESLDRMLNQAGEISIYRSRLDEHNAAIQAQLDDMTQALQRIRDQLRQLDIETDAQIAARGLVQTEGADRYAGEFDPLEMDRYTRMQELSRALSESIGDLAAVHASIDQLASEETTILLQQGRINTEVQQGLMRTLMVPFSRQVARLQRVVQQTAMEHGKRVDIAFDGVEAELDRNVLERMTAPMEHLLRNAVIHGIEAPARRQDAGKAPAGKLALSLWREGSQLLIELADDGRGLDLDAIRETAVRRGLIPEDAEVSDDEAAQFIFMPGFSTARQLTQDAGRGVGMDVVAAEVKQLGGSLELASEAGKGARFTIRLPLTLAMSQSLLVGVGHELYAAPLPSIEGIARIPREQLEAYLADESEALSYGGHQYRVRHLADLVGLPRDLGGDARTAHAILVRMPEGIGGEERRVAVVVDQLLGSRQVVSKAVGAQISTIPGVSGATILADGRVVLILDIAALVQDQTRRVLRNQMVGRTGADAPLEAHRELIMVVDDSITIRRVTERLLTKHGFAVITAKDGLDAMAQLQTERPAAILLDIEMPRADGFEVATFVRNSAQIAQTPIVMITSRSGEKHRERAATIGVNRYLIKPYQEDQLLGELAGVLEERHA